MIVFTVLYFVAAYLISLNPSKILDRIGRILTPVFAILIVILVVLGAIKYGGTSPQAASAAYQASAFGTGFLEGYNTLDALASVAFSVIAVQTLKQLGFSSKKEYIFNHLGCWYRCCPCFQRPLHRFRFPWKSFPSTS